MLPRLQWHRGPLSGRWILYADGVLWPRVELFDASTGGFAVVLFPAAGDSHTVVGCFVLLAQAQAAAEQALLSLASATDLARLGA